MSQKSDIPVIDGVAAAVKQAEALVGLQLSTSRGHAYPAAKDHAGMLAPFAPPKQARSRRPTILPELAKCRILRAGSFVR